LPPLTPSFHPPTPRRCALHPLNYVPALTDEPGIPLSAYGGLRAACQQPTVFLFFSISKGPQSTMLGKCARGPAGEPGSASVTPSLQFYTLFQAIEPLASSVLSTTITTDGGLAPESSSAAPAPKSSSAGPAVCKLPLLQPDLLPTCVARHISWGLAPFRHILICIWTHHGRLSSPATGLIGILLCLLMTPQSTNFPELIPQWLRMEVWPLNLPLQPSRA